MDLQQELDALKAKMAGAETERDKAKADLVEVKSTAEKLLDENAGLSRAADDAKKTIDKMASGLTGGGGGSGGTPPSGDQAAQGDDKRTFWNKITDGIDTIAYWPGKPPEKT